MPERGRSEFKRRQFLGTAAGAGLAALAAPRRAFAADASVVLSPAVPGAAISPHLYGHFIEHLGGVMYDGIWVGRDSKIPNVDGHRKQFVDDMKRIGAPNLRWPGGCFADGYHWRDGIGPPPGARARTTSGSSACLRVFTATETNQFGIHEFMRLCRLVAAEPYVAANVGSGSRAGVPRLGVLLQRSRGKRSPSPTSAPPNGSTASRSRSSTGAWATSRGAAAATCPAASTPRSTASTSTQVPVYTRPFLWPTGPRGHSADRDLAWTEGFFAGLQSVRGLGASVDGFALHYYTDFRQTAEGRRQVRREGLVRGPAQGPRASRA